MRKKLRLLSVLKLNDVDIFLSDFEFNWDQYETEIPSPSSPTLVSVTEEDINSSRRVARIWKGGGGFFERVRKVQTTLTRIFIALESESHGLSDRKLRRNFSEARKFQRFFSPKTGGLQKKKRSSPKLRLIFRP